MNGPATPLMLGAKPALKWLSRGFILSYFSPQKKTAQKRYKAFVESILGRLGDSPLKNLPGGMILGRKQFVETICMEHLSDKLPARDLPALKQVMAEIDRAIQSQACDPAWPF